MSQEQPGGLDYWRDNARHWVGNADVVAAMTGAVTEALVERLSVGPGDHVLDVAAGTGEPSFRVAERVGPGGRVTATDGVPEMVRSLRLRAEERGLTWITPVHASAEQLDYPEASFDAACCRFGVMFFDDPVAALANMCRCVRPGGRLVVTSWSTPAKNPYFTLTSSVLDDVGAPEIPSPRTVFEFESPGRLADVARQAGWQVDADETLDFHMTLEDTRPDDLLEVQARLSRKLGQRADALDAAARERARLAAARLAAAHVRGDDIAFPAQCRLVSGGPPAQG